jgi:hypothetical protein
MVPYRLSFGDDPVDCDQVYITSKEPLSRQKRELKIGHKGT